MNYTPQGKKKNTAIKYIKIMNKHFAIYLKQENIV